MGIKSLCSVYYSQFLDAPELNLKKLEKKDVSELSLKEIRNHLILCFQN